MKQDTPPRLILSQNMKRLRKIRGWSQEVLASSSGLHRTYIGAVERGERNISIDNIGRISSALGVSPDTLMRKNDE